MARTLKRIPRKNRRPKPTKTRRPKAGGTRRRLRGGAVGGFNQFLQKEVSLTNGLQNGYDSVRNLFTTEQTPPTTFLPKTAISAPGAAVKRLVAPGTVTGGSRRRRRRNKTKKH
jgi:hypothetical protein